ncbi:MAG: hypothetical protein LBQ13_01820 [Endomicrobium sp.]|jgi:hypothetical protein|nr:hypothetical protein [Endomicrobium sp.]
MAEKVEKVGVKREPGYLYFLDKQGDVSRALMARGGKKVGAKTGKPSKVEKIGVKKEKGFFYFIDKQGDISRSLMARGVKKEADKTAKKSVKRFINKSAKK